MELKELLAEAESLKTELEALKDLPDLLAEHDACMYRLFMLARKIEVPEKVADENIFRPNMVEPAAFLAETIANQLRLKLQLQELKEKKGAEA